MHTLVDVPVTLVERPYGSAPTCRDARAYRFFEQRRILENQPKTKGRTSNETLCGEGGFALQHDDGKRWVVTGNF